MSGALLRRRQLLGSEQFILGGGAEADLNAKRTGKNDLCAQIIATHEFKVFGGKAIKEGIEQDGRTARQNDGIVDRLGKACELIEQAFRAADRRARKELKFQ